MFRQALGYPTRSPEGGRSVIVGGFVLLAVSVCLGAAALDPPLAYLAALGVLPWLLARGYYVRVIRTTIGVDRPTPPRFDGVRRLLVDGVTAAGIAIAYLLPPLVVLAPLVAVQAVGADLSAAFGFGAVPDPAVSVLVAVVGLLAVVALMAFIGALYVLPVAVARYAHSGRRRAAIELRTVVNGALTEDYATAWAVSFLVQLLLLPVAYLLRLLVVGFFLHFIVAVGVRYCYGRGVGAALGLSPVTTESADDSAEVTDADERKRGGPRDAFVRVDTAQWGVSAGGTGPTDDPYPRAGAVAVLTPPSDSGDPSDSNDPTAVSGAGTAPFDLPSATRRVRDDERSEDL